MARSGKVDRERLITIAQDLADRQGFDHFTLAEIAARVEVRLPSLYNHIANLDDVKRAVVLTSMAALTHVLRVAVTGRAGDDAIWAMATAYRDFAHRHPGWYDAIQAARRYPDAEVLAVGDEAVEIVTAVMAAYHLADDDALHAVRALRSVVHGFASLELSGGFGLALDRDESYRRLIALYLAGLHAAGG